MVHGHGDADARIALLLDGMDEFTGDLRVAPGLFALVGLGQVGVHTVEGVAEVPAGTHGLGVLRGGQHHVIVVVDGHIGSQPVFLAVDGKRGDHALDVALALGGGSLLGNHRDAAGNHCGGTDHGDGTAGDQTSVVPLEGDAAADKACGDQCDSKHGGTGAAKALLGGRVLLGRSVLRGVLLGTCRGTGPATGLDRGVVLDLLASGIRLDLDNQILAIVLRIGGFTGLELAHLPFEVARGAVRAQIGRHGGRALHQACGLAAGIGNLESVRTGIHAFHCDAHRCARIGFGRRSGNRESDHHHDRGNQRHERRHPHAVATLSAECWCGDMLRMQQHCLSL